MSLFRRTTTFPPYHAKTLMARLFWRSTLVISLKGLGKLTPVKSKPSFCRYLLGLLLCFVSLSWTQRPSQTLVVGVFDVNYCLFLPKLLLVKEVRTFLHKAAQNVQYQCKDPLLSPKPSLTHYAQTAQAARWSHLSHHPTSARFYQR